MIKRQTFLYLCAAGLLTSACSNGMPKLFWDVDEGKGPAYAQGQEQTTSAPARQPLDVPPELRADMQMPMADKVASENANAPMPERYSKQIEGKPVALDARVYTQAPAAVFSATVDAMTSLNIPVESVDSPSGIITSDWVRRGQNNPGIFAMFGASNKAPTRHRYIVRVFRAELQGKVITKLEIRIIGQAYENGHWVNRPFTRKVTDDLFTAVEEQLARMKPAAPATPAEQQPATPAEQQPAAPAEQPAVAPAAATESN